VAKLLARWRKSWMTRSKTPSKRPGHGEDMRLDYYMRLPLFSHGVDVLVRAESAAGELNSSSLR